MFSKTKISGVALATLVAVAFIACGGGSGDKAKLEASCMACADLHNEFVDTNEKCNPSTYKNDCKALLKIYKDECDKGNGESCYKAGQAYVVIEDTQNLSEMAGEGRRSDPIEAVSWLKKSCDLKNGKGCESLAYAYEFQMRDKDKAQEIYNKQIMPIYEKECDSGNIVSCANAGNIFVKGHYVFQNYHKGLQLLQKYCDKVKSKDDGDIFSCLTLGSMFADGKGTTQDYEQAKKYFKKVCDMGEQEGCDAYRKANEKSK